MKHSSLINFDENPIIAAVRTKEDFSRALATDVQTVFLLSSNIMDVDEYAREAHEAGKKLFVHHIKDVEAGHICNVEFRNIKVKPNVKSHIRGYTEENRVQGVRYVNYSVGGKTASTAEEAGLQIGEYSDYVTVTR